MEQTRWCGGCAAETAYVRFDCAEHPEDCVELVCELCGAGLELATLQVASPGPASGRSRGARRSA